MQLVAASRWQRSHMWLAGCAADIVLSVRLTRCSWRRMWRCLLAPVQCRCWQSGHES